MAPPPLHTGNLGMQWDTNQHPSEALWALGQPATLPQTDRTAPGNGLLSRVPTGHPLPEN